MENCGEIKDAPSDLAEASCFENKLQTNTSPSFTGPFKAMLQNKDRMLMHEGDISELTDMISEISEKGPLGDLIIYTLGVQIIVFFFC